LQLARIQVAGQGAGNGSTRAARVLRTGIALVHAGELVLPAAGSEAAAERVAADDRATVQYIFPVEIEVRASPAPLDPDDLVHRALYALAQGLQGLSGTV
jgi:hypothetical protein